MKQYKVMLISDGTFHDENGHAYTHGFVTTYVISARNEKTAGWAALDRIRSDTDTRDFAGGPPQNTAVLEIFKLKHKLAS